MDSGEPTQAWAKSTLGGPLDGMLAEYAALHEDGWVAVPEHLTDVETATLPVVLGTGGAALFAVQFAKLHGARVILTSGSDEKSSDISRGPFPGPPDPSQAVANRVHTNGVSWRCFLFLDTACSQTFYHEALQK